MSERSRIEEVYGGYRSQGASSRWSSRNPGNRAITAEREAVTRTLIAEAGLLGRRLEIIEVGCGNGAELERCISWFDPGSVRVGVDILPDRLGAAKATTDAHLVCADAGQLPLCTASQDVAMAVTLFSSILDAGLRRRVADEIIRVLRPGGVVLWYDMRYRNRANPGVAPVTAAELGRLFPGFEVRLRSLTVVPPLARRLGPVTPAAYPLLSRIRPLHGHLAGTLRKP